VIVKHIAGADVRFGFTDFLTTEAKKPDRQRDQEFGDRLATPEAITVSWEAGWACHLPVLSFPVSK
jgi:hypothetical protein